MELIEIKSEDEELKVDLIQPALNSLRLLTYQFNDILDFASFESNSFSYKFSTFSLRELFELLKVIYSSSLKTKNQNFYIICDEYI